MCLLVFQIQRVYLNDIKGKSIVYHHIKGKLSVNLQDHRAIGFKKVCQGSYSLCLMFSAITDYLILLLVQGLLEKFEFLPIKCRIQWAVDNFRQYQEDLRRNVGFWTQGASGLLKQAGLRTKVIYVLIPYSYYSFLDQKQLSDWAMNKRKYCSVYYFLYVA
jgi:hypothetical protein